MNKFINNPNEQLLNIKCKQLLHKKFYISTNKQKIPKKSNTRGK